jgi:integrase
MNFTDTLASTPAVASLCNHLHKSANDNLCNQLHGPLGDRVAFYADAARSSATRRAYASDMAAFTAWGGRIPASPETVASYLAASDSLAAATLRRRLAAIADAHQVVGHPDPTKHPLVRKVFRGIRRVHGARTDAATPLDVDMLARIVAVLPEDLASIRDRALLLVGFFCALRRSELVALAVEDLDRRPDGWIIAIRRSKTDPYGKGQYVPLPALPRPLCPTAALVDWLTIAEITHGPVFRTICGERELASTLPAPQVGSILRQRAAEAGLDVQLLSAHSLRSGFAVSATRAGIAAAQIQAVTRHRTLGGLAPYIRTAGPPSTAQLLGLPPLNALAPIAMNQDRSKQRPKNVHAAPTGTEGCQYPSTKASQHQSRLSLRPCIELKPNC